jgi:hypothetical protein
MFCRWIEKYINEVKKKSGNQSTTFVSNETRSSANRMKNIGFKNNDTNTPNSNITIDGKGNQVLSAGAVSEQEIIRSLPFISQPSRQKEQLNSCQPVPLSHLMSNENNPYSHNITYSP